MWRYKISIIKYGTFTEIKTYRNIYIHKFYNLYNLRRVLQIVFRNNYSICIVYVYYRSCYQYKLKKELIKSITFK